MAKQELVCPFCYEKIIPAGTGGDMLQQEQHTYQYDVRIEPKTALDGYSITGGRIHIRAHGPARLIVTVKGHTDLPFPHYTNGKKVARG